MINHQFMSNPLAMGMRKHFFDILQERYLNHQDIIDRVSSQIVTEKDFKELGELIAAIYEKAFLEAMDQQKALLEKHGLKVTIAAGIDKSKEKLIFNQSEKSG